MIYIVSHFRPIIRNLLNCQYRSIVSQKLSYGQGGICHLNLTKQNYKIELQTIWEDYATIDIEDLRESNKYLVMQNGRECTISDENINQGHQSVIMKLKIPQDFTLKGIFSGSLKQINSKLRTNKLRSETFNLTIIGTGELQINSLQTVKMEIKAKDASVFIKNLTLEQGIIQCKNFQTKKLMVSKQINIEANISTIIKSLIMYEKAQSIIRTKKFTNQSMEGSAQIDSEEINISRIYSKINDKIMIKCKDIIKCQIQSGFIEVKQEKNGLGILTVGKRHQGSVISERNLSSDYVYYKIKGQ